MKTLTTEQSKALQKGFIELFEKHNIKAAVGLKPGGGIVIRSQDSLLDVSNTGVVRALDTK